MGILATPNAGENQEKEPSLREIIIIKICLLIPLIFFLFSFLILDKYQFNRQN
jgi:hypothetical protein